MVARKYIKILLFCTASDIINVTDGANRMAVKRGASWPHESFKNTRSNCK